MANINFSSKLRQLRFEAGLSISQLAKKVGVSVSYISKIENGVFNPPSESIIHKMARALDVDFNDLLRLAGKIPHKLRKRSREHGLLYFSPKLKELRNKSGLSQMKFANQVRVDPGYVSKLENGKVPPPSYEILLRMAKVLKVNKVELLTLAGKSQSQVTEKMGVNKMLGNIYKSIKRDVSIPNLSWFTNKGWVRVAISVLLVISIAGGLLLASPSPAEAVTVSFPSTPAGTQGSSHTFQVRVDIQGATDLLPVRSIDLWVKDQNPGIYGFTLTGVPLTATTQNYSPSGVGTVSVTATPGSNWAYATSGATTRYGYGYGYTTKTWGYHFFPPGYGYGYTGGVPGDTYIVFTVTWTLPATWPTGTYYTNAIVHGNVGPATPFTSPTPGSFTISAAAPPAPPPVGGGGGGGGGGGLESVKSSVDVSKIVDRTGRFTSSVTVSSADGKATIEIPRGTVGFIDGKPLSTVSITNVNKPNAPPPGSSFLGIHFDFEPSGATFDPYAMLTFEYKSSQLPPGATPENLTIAYYDEDSGQWVELGAEDIVIDPATNTITARVTHFTVFSVLVRTNPATFEVSGLVVPTTEIGIAEKANISAMVKNTGDLAGTTTVTLKINGVQVGSESVKLAGGEMRRVSFTSVQGKAGSYTVEIDVITATFTVKAISLAPIVIASSVPQVKAPSAEYMVPTAPTAPPVPALPAPEPTPWLAIILSLVITGIIAGVLVWYFGFRQESYY